MKPARVGAVSWILVTVVGASSAKSQVPAQGGWWEVAQAERRYPGGPGPAGLRPGGPPRAAYQVLGLWELEDILGPYTMDHLQRHALFLGAEGLPEGRLVDAGPQGMVLQIRVGWTPVAELLDANRDRVFDWARLSEGPLPAGARRPADRPYPSAPPAVPYPTRGSAAYENGYPPRFPAQGYPSEPPRRAEVPNVYALVARHSGKCVGVAGGVLEDLGSVIQWDCLPAWDQGWELRPMADGLYHVVNLNSGKCLDVEGVSVVDGASLIQWSCNPGSLNQLWDLLDVDGARVLVAAHSGKCLDVAGVSWASGAPLHQWPCMGPQQTNQLFELRPFSAAATTY